VPIDLMLGLLIGSIALGSLLLFDLLVGRAGSGGGVILRLRGRIDGPGPRGSIAHRPGRGDSPFLLRSEHGLTRILPSDAVVAAPWPLRARALRVGERVVVDGLVGHERIVESLYREAGCREAIDAVRITPIRWVLARGVALALCAGILLGGIALSRRPLYARLVWGLACPPGTDPAYAERRLPSRRAPVELRDLGDLHGQLAACVVDGKPHGPAVERWRGELRDEIWRRTGSYLEGKQHGRWVTWMPDGRVAAEGELLEGARHGVFRSWHENGRLRTREDYLEGRLHGLFTSWDRQGALEDQGMLLEGRRVGSWSIRSGEVSCPLPVPFRQQIDQVTLHYRDGVIDGAVSCFPTRMRPAVVGEVRAGGAAVRIVTPGSLGAIGGLVGLGLERGARRWRAAIAPERIGCRLCATPDPRGWPGLGLNRISLSRSPERERELERVLSDRVWQGAEDVLRCLHRAPDAHESLAEERLLALRVESSGQLRLLPEAARSWPEPVFGCLRQAIERWPGLNPALLGAIETDAFLTLSLTLHRDRRRD
jgi:hypothetical protein